MHDFSDFVEWLTGRCPPGNNFQFDTLGGNKTFRAVYDPIQESLSIIDRRTQPHSKEAVWKVFSRYIWLTVSKPDLAVRTKAYAAPASIRPDPQMWKADEGNPGTVWAPFVAAIVHRWVTNP